MKRKDGRKLLKWNAVPTIFDFSNPRKRKQTGNESKKISTKKRASFGNASSDMYSINDDTTATSKELAMSVSQNQTNVTDDDVVEYAMEEVNYLCPFSTCAEVVGIVNLYMVYYKPILIYIIFSYTYIAEVHTSVFD